MPSKTKEVETELDEDQSAIEIMNKVREMSFKILNLCIEHNLNDGYIPFALAHAAGFSVRIISKEYKKDFHKAITFAALALSDGAGIDSDVRFETVAVGGGLN